MDDTVYVSDRVKNRFRPTGDADMQVTLGERCRRSCAARKSPPALNRRTVHLSLSHSWFSKVELEEKDPWEWSFSVGGGTGARVKCLCGEPRPRRTICCLKATQPPEINWGRFYLKQRRVWQYEDRTWSTFSPPRRHVPNNVLQSGPALARQTKESSTLAGGNVFQELDDLLRECRSRNWDGFAAEPVTEATHQAAKRFCETLPSNFPEPEVAADPDGEISFDWQKGPRLAFSVSVGSEGRLSYAGAFGDGRLRGTEVLRDELPETIVRSLTRLFS